MPLRLFPNGLNIFGNKDISTGIYDGSLVMGNLMLAAHSLGLGTCCLGGPLRFLQSSPEAAPYMEKLGINPDYSILFLIAVGYPDEEPAAKPRDLSKIHYLGD